MGGNLTTSRRRLCSTKVPIALALAASLIRSPSQWPGNCLSFLDFGWAQVSSRHIGNLPAPTGAFAVAVAQAGDQVTA